MNVYILLHLGMVVSRMGIAIKSMMSGRYLNLRTLRLEPVDKRRREDYVFGYDWNRNVPYGFKLYTREGYLTVDSKYRRMTIYRGHKRRGKDIPSGFEFHFVSPTKCKSIVIGHDSGLCMADVGREVKFKECMPPGRESLEFRFQIKVFRDRCEYLEKSRRGLHGDRDKDGEKDTKEKDQEERISSETTDDEEPGCKKNLEEDEKKEEEEREEKKEKTKKKEKKKKKHREPKSDEESLEEFMEHVRFKKPRIKKKMKRLGSRFKKKLAKSLLKVDKKKKKSRDSSTS
ncbi:uncharacterized protein Eint_070990 [Encephalitozoon intestinalis ATCC 50506]|uniref:Uncharacterized protein n=1 Tax=Encephalitozoon intestinalis (strain ATCC 50506) TaxID=876142 RepID=E0S827_ENCIT|nr:uncharacterized protein Eint_070990 [Encephalitozoon intestinalis ATCC 50506]ADM11862.1 hypothetical protein Eint_070990 [Encephalitozoon intestinalis ATCC 50506]UTX45617.1 hypothetical protein GPK93_07g11820 [Encephalitozoon intestinalis]